MERLELEDYLLVAEAVLGIDAQVLKEHVDIGLAESALAAPFAGFGEFDLYPEPATMAAILCSRIVKNHALPDGNKRTGLLCMLEFVERNGLQWKSPDQDELAQTIEQLAAGALTEADFAAWAAQFIS
jgi:death-on-curing protein